MDRNRILQPAKAQASKPVSIEAAEAKVVRYNHPRPLKTLCDHPKQPMTTSYPDGRPEPKGERQGMALHVPCYTESLRPVRGFTHGETEIPSELHYEITGEHATHVNIIWTSKRVTYAEGAYTEIRWEEVKVPGKVQASDDYRINRDPRPEPEAKLPGVAFTPLSNGQRKHFRKKHAAPIVPSIASHGERPVASYVQTLADPDTGRLGSWGIGSPTIVGKRLVRESDGGGEKARGILASQWRDAQSSRFQGR